MKKMTNIISITLITSLLSIQYNTQAAVKTPVKYSNGIVASDHYLASKAGADVLKNGGNAFDAAIATSLVLSVIRNQSTGIGGGGFMVIHSAKGEDIVIDYREIAPKKAFRDMYLDKNKKPIPNMSTKGYMAVGVPGNLSGLDYILKKYGTKTFKELSKDAINYAQNGFAVDEHFAVASETLFKRGYTSELSKTFFNTQGKPKKVGDIQKNIDLANTLKTLGQKGIEDFYKGSISNKIVNAMSKNGGIISSLDLANYKPKIRKPLVGDYRGYKIVTMPPPSSGGIVLLETLNIMENYNIGWNSTGFASSEYVHLLTEAMKHSFADRAEYLGDPDFVKIPLDMLISKQHAKTLKNKIDPSKTQENSTYGSKVLGEDHGTTHYSIVDKFGNIVAATETVNTYFGSQVVIPGTGILMNNQMDDFSVQPGVPNAFGLIGNENNSIQAGKKPLSSMSPTIILKNNKPFMAVGASGGPRIITGTLNTIMNVIDFGMNIEEAVSSQRFHHQWYPNKLFIERDMPNDVKENLIKKGHELSTGEAESAVQAIMIKDGKITGASDPRKGGLPQGY
jgi:gamma-glutamyltranspeptidase/glutathione hydrolase